METEVVIAALKLAPEEVPISPSFEVCIIYEDELDERIVSIMRKMNFMPGMGLEKEQQGLPKFIKLKVPISKYRLGY